MDQSSATRSASTSVFTRADPRWARLHKIISEKSLQTGDFTLSSGRESQYLFQLRQTTLHPEGAALIGAVISDYMQQQGLRCIGGLEMGAVPIVAEVAAMSHVRGFPVLVFFVRKQAKARGARERIDGYVNENDEVLLLDDVATTGGSILAALEALREEKHQVSVRRALVIIDREEGAAQALAEKGIELVSLFRKSDFAIKAPA
jgi:orotate phosphoribosyltransferase